MFRRSLPQHAVCCGVAATISLANVHAYADPVDRAHGGLIALLEDQFDQFVVDCTGKRNETESPLPIKLRNYDVPVVGDTAKLAAGEAVNAGAVDPTQIFSQIFEIKDRKQLVQQLRGLSQMPYPDRRWIPIPKLEPIPSNPALYFNATCQDYVAAQVTAGYTSPWFETEIHSKFQNSDKAAIAFSLGRFVSPLAKILEDSSAPEYTDSLFFLWREFAARKIPKDGKRFLVRDFVGIPYYRTTEASRAQDLRAMVHTKLSYFGASLQGDTTAGTSAADSISATTKGVLILGSTTRDKIFVPILNSIPLKTPKEIRDELLGRATLRSPAGLELEGGDGKGEVELIGLPRRACDGGQWTFTVEESKANISSADYSDNTRTCVLRYAVSNVAVSGNTVDVALTHCDTVEDLALQLTAKLDAEERLTIKDLNVKCEKGDCTVIVDKTNVILPRHWSLDSINLLENSWTCEDSAKKKQQITPQKSSDRFVFKSVTLPLTCNSNGQVVKLRLQPPLPQEVKRDVYRKIFNIELR
jgi:hypothetical protein